MSEFTPALPPRGERFTDKTAAVVWAAIIALPAALQHQILAALRDLLACLEGTTTHATRVRHAICCLREAHDILGRSPSSHDYKLLLAERGKGLGWPAESNIRTWLGGSWNNALRQAALEAVADGDVVVVKNGPALTVAEITSALQECAAEIKDVPTISQYYAWARRPEVKARGRRPQSQAPFDRVFGGYYEALVAAGLVGGDAPVARSTVVRLGSYYVTHDQIFEALQEVSRKLGRSPRTKEYGTERERIIADSVETSQPRSLPSVSKIQKEFGNWDAALVAAGLQPPGGRATRSNEGGRGRKGPRIPNEDALAVLREAYAAVGEPFTINAFKAWRITQKLRDRDARRFRHLPWYDLYLGRWGSWQNALQTALPTTEDSTQDDPEVAA